MPRFKLTKFDRDFIQDFCSNNLASKGEMSRLFDISSKNITKLSNNLAECNSPSAPIQLNEMAKLIILVRQLDIDESQECTLNDYIKRLVRTGAQRLYAERPLRKKKDQQRAVALELARKIRYSKVLPNDPENRNFHYDFHKPHVGRPRKNDLEAIREIREMSRRDRSVGS